MVEKSTITQISGPVVSRRGALQLAAGAVAITALPSHSEGATNAPASADDNVTLSLEVNGVAHRITIDPRQSILDVLREKLDLPGTKKGCNQGACGACTVLVDGRRIVSCLTLAAMFDGSQIETIEGLERDGELHPLQQSFVDHEGLQCGFCTPGQIMSGIACIKEGHATSSDEIRFWMSGNICRCGAYPGIVEAIAETAGRS